MPASLPMPNMPLKAKCEEKETRECRETQVAWKGV